MKKLAILILTALLVGVAYYIFQQPSEVSETESTTSEASSPTPQLSSAPTTATTPTEGTYTTYSSSSIATTPGTKILFFHAPWCPQCRALEKSIEEGEIPAGVTIMKVDYDSNQQLRKTYGVTIQTTLVRVNDDGSLAEKYIAYDKPTLEALKDNLL